MAPPMRMLVGLYLSHLQMKKFHCWHKNTLSQVQKNHDDHIAIKGKKSDFCSDCLAYAGNTMLIGVIGLIELHTLEIIVKTSPYVNFWD